METVGNLAFSSENVEVIFLNMFFLSKCVKENNNIRKLEGNPIAFLQEEPV